MAKPLPPSRRTVLMLHPILRFAFACLLLLAAQGEALEVRESRWGFDGKAVPGRFNILSIRLFETGPKPFDGEISLVETRGVGQVVGAPHAQVTYLTPGTERWVQFVVYVSGEHEWSLRDR